MKTNSLHIREVTSNDVELLKNIMSSTFRESYEILDGKEAIDLYINQYFKIDDLVRLISQKGSHLYLVHLLGNPIGYLQLNEPGYQSDLEEKECIEIQRIYLLKEFQGKGYGTMMMNWIEQKVKTLHYSRIWLGVWKLNPKAVNFYNKLGYQIFGSHSFPMASGTDSDYLMEKILYK